MNPTSYYKYKHSSDISRTLAKNNFKPKLKTGIEKKKDVVFYLYELGKKNTKTLDKLKKEL